VIYDGTARDCFNLLILIETERRIVTLLQALYNNRLVEPDHGTAVKTE
jgi:hypothetical protein